MKTLALAAAAAAFAVLAASCGGASQAGSGLEGYLGDVGPQQSAYRKAQSGAIHGLDLIERNGPAARVCRRSSHLIEHARDEYGQLRIHMSSIVPPAGLRAAHEKLVRSLQIYSRYFDQLRQVIAFCNAGQLVAASTSRLPLRAQSLRAQWRVAVLGAAAKEGLEVPGWTREVGRPAQ